METKTLGDVYLDVKKDLKLHDPEKALNKQKEVLKEKREKTRTEDLVPQEARGIDRARVTQTLQNEETLEEEEPNR